MVTFGDIFSFISIASQYSDFNIYIRNAYNDIVGNEGYEKQIFNALYQNIPLDVDDIYGADNGFPKLNSDVLPIDHCIRFADGYIVPVYSIDYGRIRTALVEISHDESMFNDYRNVFIEHKIVPESIERIMKYIVYGK